MNTSSRNSIFKQPIRWLSLLLPLVLILAACAPAATPVTTEAPAATEAPTEAPTQPAAVTPAPVTTEAATAAVTAALPNTGSEASINVATDPSLGQILVDGKGMTLYMYAKDTPDKSNCSAGCLKAWPPLLTQGSPTLGPGVNSSLLGTATTTDGRQMVTYNHMPLYYYVKDQKPGDVLGQNVGSVWFVVSPDGKVVGGALPGPAATAGPAVTAVVTSTTAVTGSTSATEPTINVKDDAKLGKILVDGKGMTLYMYTVDAPDKSNCAGGCLKAWPPLLTQGKPVAGPGVDAAMLGSATMPDGSKIVTYNHMPLYYWQKDKAPGDTTGQGVGSVWYVVSPEGKPVGMEAPASTAAPASSTSGSNAINLVKSAKYGSILVDGAGMTLYMYAKDGPNQSNCSAGCLKAWPPLLAGASLPVLGPGLDAKLLGTATLPDGRKIVTYNKMPLYYYVKDTKPGDVTGQGVGNVWYVVNGAGKPVGYTPPAMY